MSSIDRGRVGCTSDYSNIVRMSSGISISNWKSSSYLSNGVGLRICFSFTLAIVSSISIVSIGSRSSDSMTSISKMSSIDRGRVGCTSDYSNIVRMSSGISISNWKSSSYLSNCVCLRICFSFTLAVVSSISIVSIGCCITKMTSISSVHTTVTKSFDTTHKTMAIINTSYNTSRGVSSCNLANSVGITVSIDSSQGQEDCDKSSHDDLAELSN